MLLGVRWALEGFGAPFYGRLVDGLGWRTVAPAVFALSSANGCIGWILLSAVEEDGGGTAHGVLLVTVLVTIVIFFFLVSGADLCVKAMGVTWRQAPLLVQGNDLGAAVGPVLGYALLQLGLPPSAVLAAQSFIHAAAAMVAYTMAKTEDLPSRSRDSSGTSSRITHAKDTGSTALQEADAAAEQFGMEQCDLGERA